MTLTARRRPNRWGSKTSNQLGRVEGQPRGAMCSVRFRRPRSTWPTERPVHAPALARPPG